MKNIILPNYPIMYKVNLAKGHPMKFRFDDFLFSYVYSGEGTMSASETDYSLGKGCGWISARNEPILLRTESSMQTIHIRISEDAVTEYLLRTTPPTATNTTKEMANEYVNVVTVSNHMLLQSLISGIEAGIDNNFRANQSLTYLKIQECINVLTYLRPELHNWFSRMNCLQKINLKDFMECHYQDNLPLEQLAQASGRSLSTFRRDFQKVFGTTPGKWLLAKRLEKAYILIKEKKIRPSECLVDLGFESFSHFSRSFKAYFGIQPSILLKESTVK